MSGREAGEGTMTATETGKRRLGRGLAALIGDELDETAALDEARGLRAVPIDRLAPNPANPRRRMGEDELDELARSIREKGLLQPILVRPLEEPGRYQIVAGERRWRAAQRAALHEVPILVRRMSDGEALEIAIVENVQRTDLNPIEEAEGYQQLIEAFDYTQEQMAETIGKSRSHIANTLRLMKLPRPVQEQLRSGALSAGHARALLTCADPAAAAQRVMREGLSVRQTEALARRLSGEQAGVSRAKGKGAKTAKSADTRALERDLSDALGLAVEITDRGRRGGRLAIGYRTLEQLDDLCRRLMRAPGR